METNLIQGFQDISLGGDDRCAEPSQKRQIGERNISNNHAPKRSIDLFDSFPEYSRVSAESKNYSEDVAERTLNSSTHLNPIGKSAHSTAHHLTRKHGQCSLNAAEDTCTSDGEQINDLFSSFNPSNEGKPGLSSIKRKPVGSTGTHLDSDETHFQESHSEAQHNLSDEHTRSLLASAGTDLDSITDTFHHTHLVPAVTHETVRPVFHETRTEKVTREIHNVDIYHHILPIKDIEVLPARHFIHSPSGTLKEIASETLPETCIPPRHSSRKG
jgi:hypothetical protein